LLPELLPRFGVYAVRARREDGAADVAEEGGQPWFHGIANYGLRPTVETSDAVPRLETHLFADAAAVAAAKLESGAPLCVEWLHFLRPEKKFLSLDALLVQIRQDIIAAREWFRQREQAQT
jgi:riboflavin kinase/FMN adenylyltransferase